MVVDPDLWSIPCKFSEKCSLLDFPTLIFVCSTPQNPKLFTTFAVVKQTSPTMTLSSHTTEAIQLLKQMVKLPSFSREENQVADLIEATLRSKGFRPQRQGNNVWAYASCFNPSQPVILLDAHIDTVRPVAGWSHDPFVAEEVADGRIFGLGTNDDGGSVVSLLSVFTQLYHQVNCIFLASAEEEVSGKNGIESVLPLLPPIDYAIVGEPTGMQPAIAEKGLMVIDVTEEGVAGHAARNEGVNAIYKAMSDIQWIESHQYNKVSPLLGPVKATVTIINAGTQHNVIPDRCQFTIDVRSNECYTNEELFAEISSHLQGKAAVRSFRLNSSHIGVSHPIVQRALSLGLQPFGSPTLSNQALLPFPSVKIGPGNSARSHTADEYICIDEIEQAIQLYISLLTGR